MISRWHTDGGCYHLHTSDYTILHLVEDLQSLLATLRGPNPTPSTAHGPNFLTIEGVPRKHLQELFYQLILIQQISGIRRQHRAVMYEDRDHQELQFIYQRRLSSQHWKPYQKPTCTRSCPPPRDRQYTARYLLPYDYVQLGRGWPPTFEPDSHRCFATQKGDLISTFHDPDTLADDYSISCFV